MPKVAYSEAERERIRNELVSVALELMARQGIQHTTVEQIYRAVGISRSFFYTFFPTKEDLIVESLYLQQPRILEYARSLMAGPELSWREAVRRFLHSCCYGEQHGIAVLTVEEQQLIFRRLSPESYAAFREKQARLFGGILESFGIRADRERISLFINLSLTVMIVRRGIPDTLPLFVPEAADATAAFQIDAIVDRLDLFRRESEFLRRINTNIRFCIYYKKKSGGKLTWDFSASSSRARRSTWKRARRTRGGCASSSTTPWKTGTTTG